METSPEVAASADREKYGPNPIVNYYPVTPIDRSIDCVSMNTLIDRGESDGVFISHHESFGECI